VLRHAHRPQNADTVSCRNHLSHLLERFYRKARSLAGKVKRKDVQALPVRVSVVDPLLDEVRLGQTVVKDITRHR